MPPKNSGAVVGRVARIQGGKIEKNKVSEVLGEITLAKGVTVASLCELLRRGELAFAEKGKKAAAPE